jgi:hypothetical protein
MNSDNSRFIASLLFSIAAWQYGKMHVVAFCRSSEVVNDE